ncbi:hypothetical protein AOLI_G00151270 [Acnodon oligacanthus]
METILVMVDELGTSLTRNFALGLFFSGASKSSSRCPWWRQDSCPCQHCENQWVSHGDEPTLTLGAIETARDYAACSFQCYRDNRGAEKEARAKCLYKRKRGRRRGRGDITTSVRGTQSCWG